MSEAQLLVRVAEAARMLSVSETWFRANVLPAMRTIAAGNGTRVDVEDLRAWVVRQKAGESIGTAESGVSASVTPGPALASGDQRESLISATEARLRRRLARSTRERSGGARADGSNVVALPRSSRHG